MTQKPQRHSVILALPPPTNRSAASQPASPPAADDAAAQASIISRFIDDILLSISPNDVSDPDSGQALAGREEGYTVTPRIGGSTGSPYLVYRKGLAAVGSA